MTRKRSPKDRLRMANIRLRAVRDVLRSSPLRAALDAKPHRGPARFIQIVSVPGRPVILALDESGQVWESHHIGRKVDGVYIKEQEWWEPVGMERREKQEAQA